MSDEINKKCTGCSVVNGEINREGFVHETRNFVLAQDAEVPLKGFLIIQSKKHINSIINFNQDERNELIELIYKTRIALEELNICREVTIVQEERSKHFHIWLFPYYDWMKEKFGKGIKYLRDINDYVIENATEQDKEEVAEAIKKLKKYFKEMN